MGGRLPTKSATWGKGRKENHRTERGPTDGWGRGGDAATARGNNDTGTSPGNNVCWVGASKARPTPKTNTAARMNSLVTQPETDPMAKAAAARPSRARRGCHGH